MKRVAAGAGLVAIAALAYLRLRGRDEPHAPAPASPAPGLAHPAVPASARPAGPPARGPAPAPVRDDDPGADDEPPPPFVQAVDDQPDRWAEVRAGGVPLFPPGFADPAERARFKAWWVDESARRAAAYRQQVPAQTYPGDEDTRALLTELYDAGEPPATGETPEAYSDRRRRYYEVWRELMVAYDAPPKAVLDQGGDPRHGAPVPLPVTPPPAPPPGP